MGRALANATSRPGRLLAVGDEEGARQLIMQYARQKGCRSRTTLAGALEVTRITLWRWERKIPGLREEIDLAIYDANAYPFKAAGREGGCG